MVIATQIAILTMLTQHFVCKKKHTLGREGKSGGMEGKRTKGKMAFENARLYVSGVSRNVVIDQKPRTMFLIPKCSQSYLQHFTIFKHYPGGGLICLPFNGREAK